MKESNNTRGNSKHLFITLKIESSGKWTGFGTLKKIKKKIKKFLDLPKNKNLQKFLYFYLKTEITKNFLCSPKTEISQNLEWFGTLYKKI